MVPNSHRPGPSASCLIIILAPTGSTQHFDAQVAGRQVGLFREDESASQEVIGFMLNSFEDGFGVFLPPAGTTPHTLAAVLLHFLSTLPEPLLTFKCAWTQTPDTGTAAGQGYA